MSKKHKTRGNRDRSFQSNGKGDSDRTTDVDAFRRNFDEIDWGRNNLIKPKPLRWPGWPIPGFDSRTRGS